MAPALPAPRETSILGARIVDGGVRFGLWAPRATRVELALVGEDRAQRNIDMHSFDDGTWQVHIEGICAQQRYGFRVHGPWDPNAGMRFNPAKLLLDPYARAITWGVDYSGPILDHTFESNYLPDPVDSAFAVPMSVVVPDSPPPRSLARRRTMAESLIYELHVKGFTLKNPLVPEHLRGTYAGLAYPAVIEHLLSIGVTAVELLPIQHFVSEPFIVGRGLSNYWGYNTLGYFAPHAAYCAVSTMGAQVAEFKAMVSAFHDAGIEVILDVVYNHTGEGGHEGPTLAFRGIDHAGYYRLTPDLRNDYDVTGCGNSVDTSQPGVLNMIVDSLRYWVTEMGVDGFRFDLATTLIRDEHHHVDHDHPFKQAIATDPVFADIKMIAEPWDVGPYGYQVGQWGPRWSEWNDRFRGFMRDYWRGNIAGVQELATRMAGSPDIYDMAGRECTASINFVTAHDGFTLRDLVTYSTKSNFDNQEDNRDGSDDNRSWNCGVEGECDDQAINGLRRRQIKNLLATTMLSVGVPMLLAGDEMGRTQKGNNNAYCQDSPISWVDWAQAGRWQDVTSFVAMLSRLRASHPVLRPSSYRYHEPVIMPDGMVSSRLQLAWLNGYAGEMGEGDWHDPARRSLGMYVSDADEAFLIFVHADPNPFHMIVPGTPWANAWTIACHTGTSEEFPTDEIMPGTPLTIPGRTVVVFQGILIPPPAPAASGSTQRPWPLPPEAEPGTDLRDAPAEPLPPARASHTDTPTTPVPPPPAPSPTTEPTAEPRPA